VAPERALLARKADARVQPKQINQAVTMPAAHTSTAENVAWHSRGIIGSSNLSEQLKTGLWQRFELRLMLVPRLPEERV
jgi:hypothetical protein